jgi:hypothetical protein
MAMHGIMKTGDTESISVKFAAHSQVDTWLATENKELNATAMYLEYLENTVVTPDLHKQRFCACSD